MFFQRSKVAVMVQNALERTAVPGPQADAGKFANMLVANLWEAIPDLIAGRKGSKPTNYALAVVALSNGLNRSRPGSEADSRLFFALGDLLQSPQAVTAGEANQADAFLIQNGMALYLSHASSKGLTPEQPEPS